MPFLFRFLSKFFVVCCLCSATAFAQSLDGVWSGNLTCSENVANRNASFTVSLELIISGANGRADRSDSQSLETFAFQLNPGGSMELQSTGQLRSDTNPRWTTRFSGRASGSDKLEMVGQMFGADARTLVRERCTVTLQRNAKSLVINAASASSDLSPLNSSRTVDAGSPAANSSSAATPELDHRTFRIKEVLPKSAPLSEAKTSAGLGGLPRGDGDTLYLPEDWLLGSGQPWHYRSTPKTPANPVKVRRQTEAELKVSEKAQALMRRIESRVMVLIADSAIVDVISTGGINFDTRFLSASMAKTVTALAAGKAVCARRIAMDTRADSVITSLQGTDLGTATLRDVLLMSSGTLEPSARDYVGTTPEESRQYLEGSGNLEQLLATPRQSAAQRGIFGKIRPGELYSYKSRDPYTVAMMLERTVGMPTTKWVEDQLLGDVKIEHQAILGTDRSGFFHGANGGVRLSLIDWIRFAVYVDNQRRSDTCFGRFIKDMGTTQIRAPGVTKGFDGYGYLTWTDNSYAPDTFWAVGYGGQRIGWSSDPNNGRVILMFSNSADRDMDQVYPLAQEWFSLGKKR
jgi:CubicO group peptidase (beta-lactamase class C family)